MNKRLKELAIQAGCDEASVFRWICSHNELERFAELVREDEAKACAEHYIAIMRDAVEQAVLKEREACAEICEGRLSEGLNFEGCAETIRARGEK
jgi:hypothetical protein